MRKKFKLILGLILVCAVSLGVAACSDNAIDNFRKQGYNVSVTYDPNGGTFVGKTGVFLVDMFNPDKFVKDADGTVHIKLMEPTSPDRPSGSSDPIYVSKSGHFVAGWYRKRIPVTNADGEVVNDDGEVLMQVDDGYVLKRDETVSSTPAYTYDDYWDFENDRLDYNPSDGEISITLYAGWVKYYEFEYFVKGESDEWEQIGSTTFNYKEVNLENSAVADKDTIWLPDWKDGAMNYVHTYANRSTVEFPKVEGTTFSKAYSDEACTQEISEKIKHGGTLDIEHGVAENRVQKIYVEVEQGVSYKISTAEQFVNNPNLHGKYEIVSDLDFSGQTWPAAFTAGTFDGKIYGKDGNDYTFSNIDAVFGSSGAINGGLFGKISADAEISHITFDTFTLDVSFVGRGLDDLSFGSFAGYIEEGAKIESVTAANGTIKIGYVNFTQDYTVNVFANGDISSITADLSGFSLQIYGAEMINDYDYTINPEPKDFPIDSTGNVTLTFFGLGITQRFDEAFFAFSYSDID